MLNPAAESSVEAVAKAGSWILLVNPVVNPVGKIDGEYANDVLYFPEVLSLAFDLNTFFD